jgi:transposase InsO family protein
VECGKKLRVLCTDWGGEFTSASFQEYFDKLGIQQHLTTPYSP